MDRRTFITSTVAFAVAPVGSAFARFDSRPPIGASQREIEAFDRGDWRMDPVQGVRYWWGVREISGMSPSLSLMVVACAWTNPKTGRSASGCTAVEGAWEESWADLYKIARSTIGCSLLGLKSKAATASRGEGYWSTHPAPLSPSQLGICDRYEAPPLR